ncbi:hypothetical protein B7494_g7059 [Chlorociboria aeruginascens]|nr:hypothetical protein B7494_g7059 [Chlorociboria aeruginascens]
MGWIWSSSSPPSSAMERSPPSEPQAEVPRSKQLSRDELAERELQSFLKQLEADARPSSTKYNRVPKQVPSSPSHSTSSHEPLSEQLLPTSMSCRETFDSAFYCQSFGGQFNNLYRYGSVRDCSEIWSDFWFCMKTRSYSNNEKERKIKQRYREKERRKYGRDEVGKSSEDVWKSRDKKVEWGEEFKVPYSDFTNTNEE